MLIELQVKGGKIADKDEYKKGILAREEKGSTAVGEGIAIPHAKSEAVKAPSLGAMTVPEGVDYEALDDEPSNLMFMIAAPNDGDVHLEVLSRLMTILMDEDFRAKLLNAKDKDEFLNIIDDMEKEKYPDEPKAEVKAAAGYKVLAVTACPTGIAHTYMAAEALEKAGKRLGISIKVETNGSGGAPQDGDFGTHLAAAAWFKTIGGYAFNFMIPILAGYIGKSIADRPGLLVGMAAAQWRFRERPLRLPAAMFPRDSSALCWRAS